MIRDMDNSSAGALVIASEIIISARRGEIRRRERRVSVSADICVLRYSVPVEPAAGHRIRGRVTPVVKEHVSDVLREEYPKVRSRRNRRVLPPQE